MRPRASSAARNAAVLNVGMMANHSGLDIFWDEGLAGESGHSVRPDVSKEVRQLFSRE
jgi:hypothetical protein